MISANISNAQNITQVGQLYCQRNSMAKSLTTVCLSCIPAGEGKFEVILEDTVIFPTGGGQPYDTGVIEVVGAGVISKVVDCARRGLVAIHIVDTEIAPQSIVEVRVDWSRRWDQMQQHSGQHIISDLAEEKGWKTFSWNMGKEKSYIEFENVSLTQTEIDQLEIVVNQFILEGHEMVLEEFQLTPEDRPDSLPSDIESGVVRNIRFGKFMGTCCGAHVPNTTAIQLIKLLNVEKVRGCNSRVWFISGNRVLETLTKCLSVERELNAILSSSPQDFAARITKKIVQIKDLTKENKKLLKLISQSTTQNSK